MIRANGLTPSWNPVLFNNAGGSNNGLDTADGMFYRSDVTRKLKMANLVDGTSNTLMIGEDVGSMNIHNGWPYSNTSNGTCAIKLNNGLRVGDSGYNNAGDWQNLYSFRSMHPGGANFALADGTVRFVRDSIATANYRAACTVDGKESLSLDN